MLTALYVTPTKPYCPRETSPIASAHAKGGEPDRDTVGKVWGQLGVDRGTVSSGGSGVNRPIFDPYLNCPAPANFSPRSPSWTEMGIRTVVITDLR